MDNCQKSTKTKLIVHPMYQHALSNLLECICNRCGSLLINSNEMDENNLQGFQRLKMVTRNCQNRQCDKCDQVIRVIEVNDISNLLLSITDGDLKLLGFRNGAHPKNLIIPHPIKE
jgi:hypothetical protein